MHISGDLLLIIGALALASLIPVLWAVVDVLRRPAWQFSPGRKALWAITLGIGWVILWPLALMSSVLYLAVLRRRLPPRLAPQPESVVQPVAVVQPLAVPAPVPAMRPPELPPAGWYRDPSGAVGERWWDGVGWTDHQRPLPD